MRCCRVVRLTRPLALPRRRYLWHSLHTVVLTETDSSDRVGGGDSLAPHTAHEASAGVEVPVDAVAVSELSYAALHRRLAEIGRATSGRPSLPGCLSHQRPNSLNGCTSTDSVLFTDSASTRSLRNCRTDDR